MKRVFAIFSGPLLGLLLLAVTLPSLGCEAFEPEMFPVGDTVVLHSLARTEYIGEWSGYDFATPQPVVVERPREQQFEIFDAAFSEQDGEFVMLPAGMFESFQITPGIAVDSSGVTFEGLEEAPREGYVTDAPVRLREGPVYLVRTRRLNGCTRYAKFEVLDLDPDGILEFRFLRNNLCNDRTLTDVDSD